MLGRLGRPAVAEDAVELLLECHARIRSFLGLARRLGEARGEAPEALADAARQVVRYFGEALPLHARDEEESLVPRLRGRDPGLDRELEAMVLEHREHQAPLGDLLAACRAVADAPHRHPERAAEVLRATAGLERHFEVHLAREEAAVFPAARRWLDGAADAAVVAEMRARRRTAGDAPAPDGPRGPGAG